MRASQSTKLVPKLNMMSDRSTRPSSAYKKSKKKIKVINKQPKVVSGYDSELVNIEIDNRGKKSYEYEVLQNELKMMKQQLESSDIDELQS